MYFISLGSNCTLAYQLKKYGYRKESHLFDWCSMSYEQLLKSLENLEEFVETIYVESISTKFTSKHDFITPSYRFKNIFYTTFAHEIIVEKDINIFREIMRRRYERFLKIENGDVMYIYLDISRKKHNYERLWNILQKYSIKYLCILCDIEGEERIEKTKYGFLYMYPFLKHYENWYMNHIDWNKIFSIILKQSELFT